MRSYMHAYMQNLYGCVHILRQRNFSLYKLLMYGYVYCMGCEKSMQVERAKALLGTESLDK